MSTDIQTLRAAAIKAVATMQLDQCVRAASKMDGTGFDGTANYETNYVTSQGRRVRIRSTEGAGTCSADVWIDTPIQQAIHYAAAMTPPLPGLLVYESHDNGRSLAVYRSGWWVPIVLELAFRYHAQDSAERVIRETSELAKAAVNFTPLPD